MFTESTSEWIQSISDDEYNNVSYRLWVWRFDIHWRKESLPGYVENNVAGSGHDEGLRNEPAALSLAALSLPMSEEAAEKDRDGVNPKDRENDWILGEDLGILGNES